jgi:DNA-binding NtrC family response regulator
MVKDKSFREDLYYRLNVVRIETPSLRDRMEDLPELVDFMLARLDKKFSTGTKEISSEAMEILKSCKWPGNVRELENVLHSASVVSKSKRILAKDLPENISSVSNSPSLSEPVQASHPQSAYQKDDTAPSDVTVVTPPQNKSLFGQTPQTVETVPHQNQYGNAQPPSSISLEESFNISYSHLRAKSANNLLENMEKEIIQRALQECGGNQVKASALLGITRATLRKRIDSYEIRY